LSELYATGKQPFDHGPASGEDKMVLHASNAKRISEGLELPELNVELDRAVWQVEKALTDKKTLEEGKGKTDVTTTDRTKGK
jgi:hypothetical protein